MNGERGVKAWLQNGACDNNAGFVAWRNEQAAGARRWQLQMAGVDLFAGVKTSIADENRKYGGVI